MVDDTQNMWIGLFVLLFSPCMIEASKVEHSASYVPCSPLLPAAVFVSAASTPNLGAFVARGMFVESKPGCLDRHAV